MSRDPDMVRDVKTPHEYLAEMNAEIAASEKQLGELRAARDALASSLGATISSKPSRASAAPRRRRRTKAEMTAIDTRIRQIFLADTSLAPADVWRVLISEGLLEDSSHDRDTVSKRIRNICKNEAVEQRERNIGIRYLFDDMEGGDQ